MSDEGYDENQEPQNSMTERHEDALTRMMLLLVSGLWVIGCVSIPIGMVHIIWPQISWPRHLLEAICYVAIGVPVILLLLLPARALLTKRG